MSEHADTTTTTKDSRHVQRLSVSEIGCQSLRLYLLWSTSQSGSEDRASAETDLHEWLAAGGALRREYIRYWSHFFPMRGLERHSEKTPLSPERVSPPSFLVPQIRSRAMWRLVVQIGIVRITRGTIYLDYLRYWLRRLLLLETRKRALLDQSDPTHVATSGPNKH